MESINEKQIRKIVNKVLKGELNRMNDDIFDIEDFWNLSSLTKEQLLRLSLDFRMFLSLTNLSDNLFYDDEHDKIVLREQAENVTKSFSQVKSYLMRRLGMQDWMIQQTKGCNGFRLIILVSNIGVNPKILVEVMKHLGWFNSRTAPPKKVNGMTIKCMSFDPIYQKSIKDDVRNKWNWLYHISPIENKESILQNGLIPSSKNKMFKYPNRVYFLKPSIPFKELVEDAYMLWEANEKNGSGLYTIFKISLNKVPLETKFYNDPRFGKSVFSDGAIPSEAIIVESDVDARNAVPTNN